MHWYSKVNQAIHQMFGSTLQLLDQEITTQYTLTVLKGLHSEISQLLLQVRHIVESFLRMVEMRIFALSIVIYLDTTQPPPILTEVFSIPMPVGTIHGILDSHLTHVISNTDHSEYMCMDITVRGVHTPLISL